jgi:hypothetical protein
MDPGYLPSGNMTFTRGEALSEQPLTLFGWIFSEYLIRAGIRSEGQLAREIMRAGYPGYLQKDGSRKPIQQEHVSNWMRGMQSPLEVWPYIRRVLNLSDDEMMRLAFVQIEGRDLEAEKGYRG